MRGFAIVLLLLAGVAPGAGELLARQFMVGSIGSAQTAAGAPGGATPIDQPVGTVTQTAAANQEETMPDISANMLAQGGAIGILAVVLFFYRRDFFRKNEREREELEERLRERTEDREELVSLIDKSNTCITNSTVATARQTDATHRLARTVENIERRAAGLPPTAGSATP
jgi:hypothetical protein